MKGTKDTMETNTYMILAIRVSDSFSLSVSLSAMCAGVNIQVFILTCGFQRKMLEFFLSVFP